MSRFVLSLDSGTTSTKCILFDHNGKILTESNRPIKQIYPEPGWVEHDAAETWKLVQQTIWECISHVDPKDCIAIGITNQRESVIVWDCNTGIPIYNEIVWQDHRTSDYCNSLISDGKNVLIREKTGLIVDAYFSATKIKWILDNVEGARERAEKGELLFGTVDCWLLWKMTGGRSHTTDVTNASRTLLFNIHQMKWDDDLLRLFDIPSSMLPDVRPSAFDYGSVSITGMPSDVHVMGMIGDQQSALFGQTCFEKGDVKITLGTGGFLLMNTGGTPVDSETGLLTTIGWDICGEKSYAMEGSFYVAGAVTQWLTDEMCLDVKIEDMADIAESVPDTNGCCIVPAFTGFGAPYWVQNASGAIFGITRGVNQAHMVRTSLESIAFQSYDVIRSMESDSGVKLTKIRVDGGVSKNRFVCQFLSDITGLTVERSDSSEATALGAAYTAGLMSGFWKDRKELISMHNVKESYVPKMSEDVRKKNIDRWERAVNAVIYVSNKSDH